MLDQSEMALTKMEASLSSCNLQRVNLAEIRDLVS